MSSPEISARQSSGRLALAVAAAVLAAAVLGSAVPAASAAGPTNLVANPKPTPTPNILLGIPDLR